MRPVQHPAFMTIGSLPFGVEANRTPILSAATIRVLVRDATGGGRAPRHR